ncbi:conserved Plasmodium protein, unknown function [Plasmodium gallinaceum]|uniref:CH-like domain-containing protein n=1 Tax=Plasmodium gallinaceum TaxID=5849 RepID=A0A1J1GU28_PLAGA|nr:conserved Plasmodium protein, unknown function [Plasmodium gallinaceum]CRG94822.1 conserved Plasmodium protein, unknown function [Plasmodium gallinaceum]
MELPREVIKWLQYLNLSHSFKNIKSASNGIIISEIINIYIPQSINMNSLENGYSKEIKKKNWLIIKRTLTSLNISFDETSIINSDKNEIISLFIQLYEYFNQKKNQKEHNCIKEEDNKLKIPSFARSTITQKVRESNVHDIIDEKRKLICTYELIEQEEYNKALIKEKEREEKENKNKNKKLSLNDITLFNELEKSSSIITINDVRNYEDYTDIKTLDSFVKSKNNIEPLTLMRSLKELNENEKQKMPKKYYEDEIIFDILSENISDYEIEKSDKKYFISCNRKMNSLYRFSNLYIYDDENINNLYEKFYIICLLKKYELISRILDQLKLFNENFNLIISLKAHQFYHLWKLFFPVVTSSKCDNEISTIIMKYLTQLLIYLKIDDITTKEILCNIILRSLFIIDNDENKDIKCFCELITLIINNDKHILINILNMIKNTMSFNFFYLFLSTLINSSLNFFIYKKDIKDIYLYYIFVGLHTNRKNIILFSLDILNTLSLLDHCQDIILLSSLLYNILEINNINYNIFLFSICSNIIFKITEIKKESEFNTEIKQMIKICSTIFKNTNNKELIYLFFLYSHKLINNDDNFFDICLKRYSELSDEEHKIFINGNVFEDLFKNICNYKIIKKSFSNIFNKNLNNLNKKNNIAILNSLLKKEKWKKESFLRILKNYIIYNKNEDLLRLLEIYNNIFEHIINNLFSGNSKIFELSKDILNFFWFSSNNELKVQSFEISINHLKNLYASYKHKSSACIQEFFAKLENDVYNFFHYVKI